MNIVLINPPHLESLDTKLDPNLGLMYLASVLRNCNFNVSILDLSFHSTDTWFTVIPKADLYGISIMTTSYHHALNIRDICKKINSNCKIIVGGSHPSALPEETAKDFDIVVVGEAEGIILHVIEHIKFDKQYPKIFYGNKKLMNIDNIPFPARDLVPIKEYTRTINGIRTTSIIASRGCIYQCSFCINSTRKLFSKTRFRSVDNIIREMKELIFKYDFKSFIFYDDSFTLHPKLDELLDKIKELNIIFRSNGNARKDKLPLFEQLYDSGCREICFGIESGSQEILDRINKKVTVEQNRNAILEAKRAGLMVKAFLMVGSPGESWDTIKETVNFINETKPQYWTLFSFVPLPGCEIYNNPEKYKIKIITKDYRQYFNIAGQNEGGSVIETEYMTIKDIKKARQYMLENLPKQIGPLQDYYKKLEKI